MKTYLSVSFAVFLILVVSFVSFANESNNNSMKSFQITTSNMVKPGSEVTVHLYGYENSYKGDKGRNSFIFGIDVFKITDPVKFFQNQPSFYYLDILGKDSSNLMYLTKEVKSFEKTLKYSNEYGYAYISENISLGIFEKGAYIVRFSHGDRVAYTGFFVSNYGVITKTGVNSILTFVTDRTTGEPVNGAELNLYFNYNKLAAGYTNNGALLLPVSSLNIIKKENNDDDILIIGSHDDEVIVSNPATYFGFFGKKYSVYLFTNQPVYRTDNEVLFKGNLRKKEQSGYSAVNYTEVEVKILDPRGAEVSKQILTTNDNGSFSGKYYIKPDAPLGNYAIITTYDNLQIGYDNFTVEQYKKPEFKVEVNADKNQYYGNDEINVDVKADYFFGAPVQNADVEYNVYKIRYYVPWWKFSDWSWWYEDYEELNEENNQGAVFIYSGKGTLDSEGKMKFTYRIKEDFKVDRKNYYWWYWDNSSTDYRYIIQAKVVDKSRREISGTKSVLVTRGGFYTNTKTSKYFYKPGEKASFEINARDYSEKNVVTDVTIKVYKMSWGRYYDKEEKKLIATLYGKTKEDGKAMIEYEIPNDAGSGYFRVESLCKDERGNEIESSAGFYVSGEDYSWWYNGQTGNVQIITDKDTYKKGEVCRALVYVPNKDANILFNTQNDNIISYSVEKVFGNTRMIEFTIDDKFVSDFDINVTYVLNETYYTGTKHIVIVPEDKFLTVELFPSKSIYKPKEEGELKVRVIDYMGSPVPNAEVSLGVIDESIYYIKQDATKDIRKFFYGRSNTYIPVNYNFNRSNYGYSRLMTILERFNVKSLKASEMGTVKGKLTDKNGEPLEGFTIVIDGKYFATVTDSEGNFEFKMPEGEYDVSVLYDNEDESSNIKIKVIKGKVVNSDIKFDKTKNEIKPGYYAEDQGIDERSGITNETMAPVDKTNKIQNAEKKDYDKNGKGKKELKEEEQTVEPELRSDFRDAILWTPFVRTDANGYATVMIKYPDNLTEWRVTARVITEDTKVGQNIAKVVTKKDLLVRMENPRFLQNGDEVTITTVIHNYLSTAKYTTVNFKAEGVQLLDAEQKKLEIKPNSEVQLDWKVKVTGTTGKAKLYCEALTNEESDAVEFKVPMQSQGLEVTRNVIIDFNDVNKTEFKTLILPVDMNIGSAVMKISVSPSIAGTLLSSLDELAGYPYGCVEQTMSRFLPSVIVAEAFKELNVPLNEKLEKELPKMVEAGLNRLYTFQHYDGGWGWWMNDESSPYMTAYVIYGLSIAEKAGYKIQGGVISKAIKALKNHLKNNDDEVTKAYMLYVLSAVDKKEDKKLNDEIGKHYKYGMNPFALSLLASAYHYNGDKQKSLELISELENKVKYYGDDAAFWEGSSFHYRWQDDKVQTTAMILKTFMAIKPESPLVGKIVRWLLMQRQGVSWRNTQETAMIVFAMVDYLKYSKELEPDFITKVYVNGKMVTEKKFTKEDVFKKDEVITIDSGYLKTGDNDIRIEKLGIGKVYFSGSVTYSDRYAGYSANESGFRVEREYFKLEKYEYYKGDKIEYRKKYFDGTVKSGDMILVKIKVYSKEDALNYFMLEDPIPAGCEITKDDWAYNIEGEKDYEGYTYYWWRWWYADKDIRDNKVTFFATYLYGGEQEFSYIMRAQIPGEYNVNPTKGMLMYYTDVNGSTPYMKLNIKE